MKGSINEAYFEINNGIGSNDTISGSFKNSIQCGFDKLFGNSTANHIRNYFDSCSRFVRFNLYNSVSVLTTTSGLADKLTFAGGRLGDSLAIGYFGFPSSCLNFEFAEKSVADNFQMKLTHTSDNRLPCFLIGRNAEGRIFV